MHLNLVSFNTFAFYFSVSLIVPYDTTLARNDVEQLNKGSDSSARSSNRLANRIILIRTTLHCHSCLIH